MPPFTPFLKGGEGGLLRFTLFTIPIKTQLMIGDLITCGLHHLLGPFRDITKVQFDHMTACFTDDMVMVILQLTELIFHI